MNFIFSCNYSLLREKCQGEGDDPMQDIQIVEHSSMRVLTTKQLATSFDTSDKIVNRNFQRNAERYEEGKHYYALTGEELKEFKATRQDDVSLKYVSTLYLWTELGAWLHAKSLNNDSAWQAYQLLIDNYFNLANKHRLGASDNMTYALPEVKIQQIESRLEILEKQLQQVTLHSGEQKRLRKAIGERVHVLSRKEPGSRPVLFRSMYRSIRERYHVESYRDVKQHQLQDALKYVARWGGTSF